MRLDFGRHSGSPRLAIMTFFLFALAASLSAAPPAAGRESPVALLRAEADPVLSWKDPLRIVLSPDEELCRKRYGDNRGVCFSYPGETGAPADLVLTPAVEGRWFWEDAGRLVFTPAVPLTPGVTYSVDLGRLALPAGARITAPAADKEGRRVLRLPTVPLAASVKDIDVLIDPAPGGVHVVSSTIGFSWPVEPAALEKRLSLRPVGSELALAEPEFVWSPARDEVTVSARMIGLADTEQAVEVRVRDLPVWLPEDSTSVEKSARREASGDVTARRLVPGRQGLFRIRRMEMVSGHDSGLGREYRIELETSLQTTPASVANALKLVALPRAVAPRPGTEGKTPAGPANQPYDWSNAPVVSPEDLTRGTTLAPEPLEAPDQLTTRMRFRVRIAPDTYVFAFLPAEFASPAGFTLGRPWKGVLKAAALQPELHFLQPGQVLPLGGAGKLDLHASGLTSIRWEIARVRDPFLALMAGGWEGFSGAVRDAYTEIVRGETPLAEGAPGTAQFAALDVKKMQAGGLMEVRLAGMVGERKAVEVSRLILMTDIGMFVKRASDGRREVFVCSLSAGAPLPGMAVRILGRNGLTVAEALTDAEGRACLPAVDGLSREREPVAIVAGSPAASGSGEAGECVSGAGDFAWFSLWDGERRIDYSAFPTGGRSAAADGLIAYVFSQRGLFRPGETLRFGCLVRRGDWAPLPPDLPLRAVLTDPAGNEILTRTFTVPEDGLGEVSWNAPVSAMTGRYRLDVRIGGSGDRSGFVLGSGAARVDEFQPDTLSMRVKVFASPAGAETNEAAGWLVTSPDGKGETADPRAAVLLRNLHGLPAQDRRIRGTFSVAPARLAFTGYEDYVFYDASPYRGEELEAPLPETRTDAEGRAALRLPVDRFSAGTMRARLLVEGFEPGGGRAVTQQKSLLLSPLRRVLGCRPAGEGTNLQYIPVGRKAQLECIALDPALSRVDPGPLTFAVSARRYAMSLIRDGRGRYRYDETPMDMPLFRSTERFDAEKTLRWTLPTDAPGDFLLRVADAGGTRLAEVPFTVAGNAVRLAGSAGREEGGNAGLAPGHLRLRLNKSDYRAGERIELFLSAPYAGTGLITLERDGVAAHRWFRTEAGDSVQSVAIPPDFEGRGYVNVALVRAQDSPDIYMEPLSSAVAPFTANLDKRDLGLKLTAPDTIRPGGTVDVALSGREGGRAFVFAVDEGVLQLTGFRTPSPLTALLRDRALDVETMQAFDLLMPDHARLAGRLPAFGGGMGRTGGRFLNPFKRRGEPPVATWTLVDVSPAGTRVSFAVPDYYNGRIRIMAVGASSATAGSAEAHVTVAGPVVLTPQVPLVVAPGDRFEAAVGVSNNLPAGKAEEAEFRLHVETEGGLALDDGKGGSGGDPAPLRIRRGDEAVARFPLRATDEPGEAVLRIRAEALPESGNAGDGAAQASDAPVTVVREVRLSVRPATPYRISTTAGVSRDGKARVAVDRERYAYRRSDAFEASPAPLPALRGLVRRLDAYPYGCTEQLVSRAFPYALLSSRPDLLVDARRDAAAVGREADAVLNAALRALQASFRPGRGVALWPDGEPDETLTVYAGDFLLALREAGKGAPAALENGVFDAIARLADRSPATLAQARVKAYGIWILTREGRITTQALEQLERSLAGLSPARKHPKAKDALPAWRRDVTATLMGASYAIMRVDKRAEALAAGYAPDVRAFPAGALLNATAASALHTAVLARHFPERLAGNEAAEEAGATLLLLDARGGATFASAQSVRALLALTERAGAVSAEGVRLTCDPAEEETRKEAEDDSGPAVPGLFRLEADCPAFLLTAPAGKTWYWQLTSGGYDRTPPASAGGRGMEVARTYTDAAGTLLKTDGGEPARVSPGVVVTVSVSARSHGGPVPNAVISDLLPGGFELVLPENGGDGVEGAGIGHAERREDRMLLFVDLDTSLRTWTYRMRAVSKGRFAVPPVQAEAMYDPAVTAHTAAGTLEVR